MTLNGEMAVILRYFTEFGKPALQKTICGVLAELLVLCSYPVRRKTKSP